MIQLGNWHPTKDDLRAIVNLTCSLLGIGSLAMGRSYGQAGFWYATTALTLMCIFNTLACVALSICMRKSPAYVQTFGDLGEYAAGKIGRYLVLITQFAACVLVPIAYLVLGGATILPMVLGDILTVNAYIILMAIVLLPFVLIRTLKEAAWASLIGAATAFFGDVFAVVDSLMHSASYSHSEPDVSLHNVLTVFGSMAMAYGIAVVVPAVQREHPKPERMPYIITFVMMSIYLVYLCIGILSYIQYGCVSPPNLLLSMSSRGMEITGLVLFFIHIVISFAVYLAPALFLFERSVFGFHKIEILNEDEKFKFEHAYETCQSPEIRGRLSSSDSTLSQYNRSKSIESGQNGHHHARRSIGSITSGAEFEYVDEDELLSAPYPLDERIKTYCLRTFVVSIQVFIALLLQGSFEDLSDLIGSSCLTSSCTILPLIMYYCYNRIKLSIWKKSVLIFIVIFCLFIGSYASYYYIVNIIDRASKYRLFTPPSVEKHTSASSGNITLADLADLSCKVFPQVKN